MISFDLSDNKKKLTGDIIISAQQACINARIFNTNPVYELYLYVAHGLLHLLGYDDKTVKDRNIMQQKAKDTLNYVGINV